MNRIPLVPDFSAARRSGDRSLIRVAVATLLAHVNGNSVASRNPSVVAKKMWPTDRGTELLTRATSTPASMTSADSNALVAMGVPTIFSGMGPSSAGAMLFSRGLQFHFDGTGTILIPNLLSAASNVGFVAEGGVIPVRQMAFDGGTLLSPKKFPVICVFNRETFNHSVPNVEAVVRIVLSESVALALDAALFDATAGDAARPAGLRLGIAASATSANPLRSGALAEDVATLAGAVAGIAGNSAIVFIASPQQAVSLRLWSGPNFSYEILASSALTAGTVIAIAPAALASATDPVPRFEISDKATLHMEGATPADIGTAGGLAAGSTISMFQSDNIALRMVTEISWGLRNVGGLAWIENATW